MVCVGEDWTLRRAGYSRDTMSPVHREDKARSLPAVKPPVSIPFLPVGFACMVGKGTASY